MQRGVTRQKMTSHLIDRQQRLLKLWRDASGWAVTLTDAAVALGTSRQTVRDDVLTLREAVLVVTDTLDSVRIAP